MNARNDIDTRIHRICQLFNTTEGEMYTLGKSLLTLSRDVYRNTNLAADDMLASLYSDCAEQEEGKWEQEALVRLEFFAAEGIRRKYETEIDNIVSTGWLMRVMDALKDKVYNFPDYGPDFASILSLTYMNTFKYSVEEIEEETGMSRSTIHRHKKRAVILFGLAFLEYKRDFRSPDPHSFGFTGEQLKFDFYQPKMRLL